MSKILDFYNDISGNANGDMLKDILAWNNEQLEIDHAYVQWIFPSNEVSMMNADAPVLTKEDSKEFQENSELGKKVKKSFIRFLDFLGFKLIDDYTIPVVVPANYYVDENDVPTQDMAITPLWLQRFNHNFLRVTRILKSLRLTGNEKYSLALFDALRNYKHKISPNSWDYWQKAIFDPLW